MGFMPSTNQSNNKEDVHSEHRQSVQTCPFFKTVNDLRDGDDGTARAVPSIRISCEDEFQHGGARLPNRSRPDVLYRDELRTNE